MPERVCRVERGCFDFREELHVDPFHRLDPIIEWILGPGNHDYLGLILGPVGIGKSWLLRWLEIQLHGMQTNEYTPSNVVAVYLNVQELFEEDGQEQLNRMELISWLRDCYRLAGRRPNPNLALDAMVERLVDPIAQERDGIVQRFVLLLDGYDRISDENRQRFDELLMIFMAHAQGHFRVVIARRAKGIWTPPETDHRTFYLYDLDGSSPAVTDQIHKLAMYKRCDPQAVLYAIQQAVPSYRFNSPLLNRYLLEAAEECQQTPLIDKMEHLIINALARNDNCGTNGTAPSLITPAQMQKLREIARGHNEDGEILKSQYARMFEGAYHIDPFHILIFQKIQILKLDKKSKNFKLISPFLELLRDLDKPTAGDEK